jgi:hypothetical protein
MRKKISAGCEDRNWLRGLSGAGGWGVCERAGKVPKRGSQPTFTSSIRRSVHAIVLLGCRGHRSGHSGVKTEMGAPHTGLTIQLNPTPCFTGFLQEQRAPLP